MANLDESMMLAFRGELSKLASGELTYTPAQTYALQRRFDMFKKLLPQEGALAGTAHKRLLIPKDKLTEDDIHQLGFQPVTIAIPEAGQDRFRSFRHPDMNYHIHSHPEGWTMHEDRHPASTMLALKAKGAINKTKALASGLPHVNEEGLPGLYYYIKGQLAGHKSTAQRVLEEESERVKRRIGSLKPSWSYTPPAEKAAAFSPGTVQRLRSVGALGAIGGLGGGLVGGAAGGLHDYREAKEHGVGTGDAMLGALGGVVRGASKGVTRGALAGAAAGGLANPEALKGLTESLAAREGVLGATSRFGQRQVHGFTGMLTPEQYEGIRGGAYSARQALGHAQAEQSAALRSFSPKPGTLDRVREAVTGVPHLERHIESQNANVNSAKKTLDAVAAATGTANAAGHADPSMNLTSIPGYVRSVAKHGPGKVLSTAAREQLTGAPLIAAAGIGMPLALSTREALTGPDVDEQGRGRGERVGRDLGMSFGGVATGALPGMAVPMGAGNLAWQAFGDVGALTGRGFDKIREKMRGKHTTVGQPGMSPATSLEPTESQNTPSERVMSPSAAGQQKDVGL